MKAAPRTAAAMAAHWTARADRFDGAASHMSHRNGWRLVLAAAIGDDSKNIIDLGCGTGACAVLLAELGHRVTGVDGSSGMLRHARAATKQSGVTIKFIESDMDSIKLPEGSADVVTLRNVLWTLEDPVAALKLAHDILKPGGMILVSDAVWRRHPDLILAEFENVLPYAQGIEEKLAGDWLAKLGFGPIIPWHQTFPESPYGDLYDTPGVPIQPFVITAKKML